MNQAEIRRMIKEEIKVALQAISSGTAGTTSADGHSEDIDSLFPGLPTLTARPVMHPFGFISRAIKGIISVTAQQGSHPGNKMTLGHRDKNAPAVEVGESAIYSNGGYVVRVFNGKVQVGKGGSFQTLICGEAMNTVLGTILDAIVAHTHQFTYVPGSNPPTQAVTLAPGNASDFTSAKGQLASTLAKDGGHF